MDTDKNADPRDGLLFAIRDLLSNYPVECLGSDTDASGQPYSIRDEVIDRITKALAHARPEAVDAEFLLRLRGFFQEINCDDDGEEYLNLSSDAMDEIDERLATLTPERAP